MFIHSYLFFDGRCEEAIDFYRETLGAEVLMLMRYGDDGPGKQSCPDGSIPPDDKVMHATLQIGETQVLASDGFSKGRPEFKGFSLSVTVDGDDEVERRIDALAEGGQVTMAPAPTFFASRFGMAVDRFGVSWMVMAPLPEEA
ncbi:VOC family protein [Oleiagrimonas soli]|uniref:3-demethylubiquinone-9 3-methyltransferase n=1 Tax=Oleiagrimonas soli TaxID=1543381 RepID=A0A099CVA8_9GAMM|nr:VOC family protein [Oleiagrimonas soli]KGI77729.1 3-demethylubiquinone-9 3-methyltransferase [Oleiagrimonas soli]MBB6182810.1 PhnB protein [Oleiagrimonas soli]